jgi:hypothetical protein
MSDPVGGWGIVLGFIPLASAALGAGATYAWQALGNHRTDDAVRVQTDARLLELVSVCTLVYRTGQLDPESLRTLTRVASSLDAMEIALALKKQPWKLVAISLLRTRCEQILMLSLERIAQIENTEAFPASEQASYARSLAEGIVQTSLLAMTTHELKVFALETAERVPGASAAH